MERIRREEEAGASAKAEAPGRVAVAHKAAVVLMKSRLRIYRVFPSWQDATFRQVRLEGIENGVCIQLKNNFPGVLGGPSETRVTKVEPKARHIPPWVEVYKWVPIVFSPL